MKQTAVEWLVREFTFKTLGGVYTTDGIDDVTHLVERAKEMEKEQACDFADYVINRAKEFEDGLIDHREYEGSIDEMFERRYRDGGAELSTEEKQYWEDVDKLRKEREEKYK
jgi:hypothetical protein